MLGILEDSLPSLSPTLHLGLQVCLLQALCTQSDAYCVLHRGKEWGTEVLGKYKKPAERLGREVAGPEPSFLTTLNS